MKKLLLILVIALLSINNLFSQEIEIGKGGYYGIDAPLVNGGYSYTQSIYKQQWIHAEGTINKISYNVNYSGPPLNVSIYMGHTSKSEIRGDLYSCEWVPFDSLTLVYEGELSLETNGWFEIDLQTPFDYNNSDNLVIAVNKHINQDENAWFIGSKIDQDYLTAWTMGYTESFDPASEFGGYLLQTVPSIKISGSFTFSPYLYIYNPVIDITTTPDSSVVFDIETNQTTFNSSCDQSWLSVASDNVNNSVKAIVISPNGALSEWQRTANITVSSDGANIDTAQVNQYRFEANKNEMKGFYFADYDLDSDLDIVGHGPLVMKNIGNDNFEWDEVVNYESWNYQCISYWADYDNDGDLDFLNTLDTIKLYKNKGSGVFEDISEFFTHLRNKGGVSTKTPWADYDNDGDWDILIFGLNQNSEPEMYLYTNQGNDVFINSNIEFTPILMGTVEWVDYDNDGNMDLSIAGSKVDGSPIFNLYKNEGKGRFLNQLPNLPKLFNASISWDDYDADGDMDLIILGSKAYYDVQEESLKHCIYRNDGNGDFVEIESNLNPTCIKMRLKA